MPRLADAICIGRKPHHVREEARDRGSWQVPSRVPARIVTAAACIARALASGSVFSINKKSWTGTYVRRTVDIDLVVVALLVYWIDVRAQFWGRTS